MRILRIGILFSAFCLLMQGCYMDNAEDLYGANCDAASTPAEALSFDDDIQSIFEANCSVSGCHSAGNGSGRVELVDRQKVGAAIENNDLKRRVADGSMPPSGELAPCDEETLIRWIEHKFPTI